MYKKRYHSKVDKERKDTRRRLAGECGWKCWYCGIPIQDDANTHVDHIIPKCMDGDTGYFNSALSCRRCNLAKSTDDLVDFMKWLDWVRSGNSTTADIIYKQLEAPSGRKNPYKGFVRGSF